MSQEKIEFAIVKGMLRSYWTAILSGKLCKKLWSTKWENDHAKLVAREIWFANGNWERAKVEIAKHCHHRRASWHVKLFAWADKVKGGDL